MSGSVQICILYETIYCLVPHPNAVHVCLQYMHLLNWLKVWHLRISEIVAVINSSQITTFSH